MGEPAALERAMFRRFLYLCGRTTVWEWPAFPPATAELFDCARERGFDEAPERNWKPALHRTGNVKTDSGVAGTGLFLEANKSRRLAQEREGEYMAVPVIIRHQHKTMPRRNFIFRLQIPCVPRASKIASQVIPRRLVIMLPASEFLARGARGIATR